MTPCREDGTGSGDLEVVTGATSLARWTTHKGTLGRTYANELTRHSR